MILWYSGKREAGTLFRKQVLTWAFWIGAALGLGCAGRGLCQTTPAPSSGHQDAAPATLQPSLRETQWNLTELDGNPVTVTAADGQPYIYLQEQGDRLSGSGGCNRFFGSYDLSGSSLEFHSVAQTLMACAGASMGREPALMEALKLTTSYQISEGVLQLKVGDRVLARFQARKK
jgi:heat shock protein HslJ